MTSSREQIFEILASVRDPEVPVLSVIDLGIVREVTVSADGVVVSITPTYSGCPAMAVIEKNIIDTLRDKGVPGAQVRTIFSPPWTTEWMSAEGKRKLKEYGIAPPGKCGPQPLLTLGKKAEAVPCPFCDSRQTRLQSQFGSTACKSLHFCDGCKQPFEHFKAF